jgi:Domain of unknown function (DUF4386)
MIAGRKSARVAGLVYLVMIVTTGLWYGIGQTFMGHDPAATVARLQANRTVFELGIVSGAIGFVDFLLLGLVLYRLFGSVAEGAARVMLAFMSVSVPLSLGAVAHQMDALSLLDAGRNLPGFPTEPLITAALQGYTNLFLVSSIFSGLWLIPFGWLVLRSRFLPRTVGVLLLLGSVFYVLAFVGTVLNPQYAATRVAQVVGVLSGAPAILGELAACIWLLIARAPRGESGPAVRTAIVS